MGRYSIEDFIQSTVEKDLNQGVFELERERLLEVNLEGMVWTKKRFDGCIHRRYSVYTGRDF